MREYRLEEEIENLPLPIGPERRTKKHKQGKTQPIKKKENDTIEIADKYLTKLKRLSTWTLIEKEDKNLRNNQTKIFLSVEDFREKIRDVKKMVKKVQILDTPGCPSCVIAEKIIKRIKEENNLDFKKFISMLY